MTSTVNKPVLIGRQVDLFEYATDEIAQEEYVTSGVI
jgi:hypothetical protein